MIAETQINLVSVVGALVVGGVLLVLVAWIDRRYLQRFEDVQSVEEDARAAGGTVSHRPAQARETTGVVAAAGSRRSRVRLALPVRPDPSDAAIAENTPAPARKAAPAVAAPAAAPAPPAPPPAGDQVPPARAEGPPAATTIDLTDDAESARSSERSAAADREPMPAATGPARATAETGRSSDDAAPIREATASNGDTTGRWQRPAGDLAPRQERRSERDDKPRLPKGAEAALLSIIEVVPDPRNTLAVTRDPTAEVHLSGRGAGGDDQRVA